MKKAKLLLTIIAVLAVVGGALAFRANQKFTRTFCILTTDAPPGDDRCTNQIDNSKFFAAGGTNPITYSYTTKNIGDICNQKHCPVSTSFITD